MDTEEKVNSDESVNEYGFIGDDKIDSAVVVLSEDGTPTEYVAVVFSGDPTPRIIHGLLFQKVVTPKSSGPGISALDMIVNVIAKECLAIVKQYDVQCNWVSHIGSAMNNLIVNANQLATRKLWGNKIPETATLSEVDNILGVGNNTDTEHLA